MIYGHDATSALTFTNDNGNISSRLLTSESVMWNIPKWKDEKSGPAQQTPELKSILQEIIDKPGWSNGNSVAFIFTDGMGSDKDAHSFDSSPSKAAVLHIVVSEPVLDTTAPILSLLGSNPQQVIENTPYVDAGATCTDNTDGNITNIVTNSNVNTALVGTYQVTYNCADSSGNNALQKTRTVNIAPHPTLSISVLPSNGDSSPFQVKIIGYTPQLQNISTGSPFGPANIVSGTTYTIIGNPGNGLVPGSIDCAINNNPPQDTSEFTVFAGDVVSCTVEYIPNQSEG